MFNSALVNLVARSVDTGLGARQRDYDGLGEGSDFSLIPLDYFSVAATDLLLGLKSTGCRLRPTGPRVRGGQGCTPRRSEQCVLPQFRLELLQVDVERQLGEARS